MELLRVVNKLIIKCLLIQLQKDKYSSNKCHIQANKRLALGHHKQKRIYLHQDKLSRNKNIKQWLQLNKLVNLHNSSNKLSLFNKLNKKKIITALQLFASLQIAQASNSYTYPLLDADMQELIRMLSKLIDWERELQLFKESLRCCCSDFNLLDAFRFFDINQNEQISKSEFEAGVNKLSIFPTETEINLFFQSYDRDMDSFLYLLRFGEFSQIFHSMNQNQVDLLNNHTPNFAQSPIKTSTLQKLLETEVLLNNYRIQLSRRSNFNLKNAFNSWDVSHDGLISQEDLKEVLNRFNVQTNEDDMINLFRRFDRNLNGEIHQEEFVQKMTSKC